MQEFQTAALMYPPADAGGKTHSGGPQQKKYSYIFITVYKGVYSEVGVYLFVYVKESFP
jgi:hypothetical protein